MEYRKLIKFGNSSHIISLPNNWIKKNKLKKGNLVYIEETGNGELILNSRLDSKNHELKEIVIEYNKNKDMEDIEREILSAYINNYNILKIKGEGIKTNYKRIRDFMRGFVAMEIIEQNSSIIVAKDLLNINEISVNDIIRKMDIITRSMIEDSIKCMDEDLYEEIYDRDLQVNRLCFLILRVVKKAMSNPTVAKSLNLNSESLISTWRLTNKIEEISDEAKRIARYIRRSRLKGERKETLKKIYTRIMNMYLESIKAYYNSDHQLAFEVASKINQLNKECDKYFKEYTDPIISKLTERMKIMLNHIKDIPRSVFE